MCKIVQVSRSSYYNWLVRKPSPQLQRRLELGIAIKRVYDRSKGRYITKELQMQGIKVSRPLVARIMKKKKIRSVTVRKFKQTTHSSHHYGLVDNKLCQDFTVQNYNQVWVSDISYIKTREACLYLTSVIDLFDRKVIGWQLSDILRAEETVLPALNKASSNRYTGGSLPYLSFRQRYSICLLSVQRGNQKIQMCGTKCEWERKLL